ncbi:Uncharacterised protein [Mycobacteroides abscessus]|nr:Uncharacterised protein [Mycobacteroides abscessus]
MTNGSQTITFVKAASAIELNAKINPANPIVDKQMDRISILGFEISPTFSVFVKAKPKTTKYNTALIQKM